MRTMKTRNSSRGNNGLELKYLYPFAILGFFVIASWKLDGVVISQEGLFGETKIKNSSSLFSSFSSTSTTTTTTTTTTSSLSQVKATHSVCDSFLGNPALISNTAYLWNHVQKSKLLNASYFPPSMAVNVQFREWIQHLFRFYSTDKLASSMAIQPSRRAIHRILQILSDYPQTKQPLEILVTGGSVTSGYNCNETPFHLKNGTSWLICAWPNRLEMLFNKVFFNGEQRIKVTSMASGGVSSDVAAILFEYQLLPDTLHPHIILLSHSANDNKYENGGDLIFKEHIPRLIQSALLLDECDPDLPLVGMVDEAYGEPNLFQSLSQTSRVFGVASWFNIMTIMHSSIVRSHVHHRYINNSIVEPIQGNGYDLHPGMGMHIGVAWTVLYNLLNAMINACLPIDEEENLPDINGNSHGPIHDSLLENWPSVESVGNWKTMEDSDPPLKYLGKAAEDTDLQSNIQEWKQRIQASKIRCEKVKSSTTANSKDSKELTKNTTSSSTTNKSASRPPLCEYIWMVNKLSKVNYKADVMRELNKVMTSNNGWKADGYPWKNPRTGWYAKRQNASFSLRIPVKTISTVRFVTILIMRSYGPTFVGTQLKLNVKIQKANTTTTTTTDDNNNRNVDGDGNSHILETEHIVSGHHELLTSVHVPYKFELPGDDGAQINDTIYFTATLISGSNFKIAGIAFCEF